MTETHTSQGHWHELHAGVEHRKAYSHSHSNTHLQHPSGQSASSKLHPNVQARGLHLVTHVQARGLHLVTHGSVQVHYSWGKSAAYLSSFDRPCISDWRMFKEHVAFLHQNMSSGALRPMGRSPWHGSRLMPLICTGSCP